MERGASLGEKVAFYRRRRGLSQVEFAALVGRSESWLSQVERGVRSIDRISVLAQLAEALSVPVGELAAETPREVEGDQRHYVDALRLALTGHPALDVVLAGPGVQQQSVDLGELGEQVGALWPLAHQSRYEELALSLEQLLPSLERLARQVGGRRRKQVYELLGVVYQAAAALLAKLDEPDAAWLASERSLVAGEDAGEPLVVAAGQYRMAQAFVSTGRLDQGRHVAELAVAALEGGADDGPEVTSLLGAFQLVLAVIAAREGDRRRARDHVEQARSLAMRLGADRNDFGTEFGPTNVAVHEVSVAVELGDAGEALEKAGGVEVVRLSPERQARFLIDVARAYGQRRRTAEAVRALEEAEAVASEQVRDHHVVREIVRDLIQVAGRRPSPELQALAEKVGVLP